VAPTSLLEEVTMPVLLSLGSKLSEWLSSASVLRMVSSLLRRHKPVLKLGTQAFVARGSDVKSVLSDSERFGVTEIYAAKMERTTGAFILGMENTPLYAREASFIRAAVIPSDLARVRSLAGARAEELLLAVKAKGRIDVVSDYARLIPLHIVQTYFGVRGPELRSTYQRWLRNIFWDLFLNLGGDARVAQAALVDAAGLRDHLDEVILEHRSALRAGTAPDDFVTRLLGLRASEYAELDDVALRRNIGGVIVGAVETQAKAIVYALAELLSRPAELAHARRAAAAGDDELVSRYVFEALRFNPHNPLIVRRCHQDTTIGAGTPHETSVTRGTTVYALTLSAMFDEELVNDPESFRIDRPREQYLHFGYGQHQCFGTQLNYVVLPEAIKRLLLLPNLRVSEQTPRPEHEGPFPDRFILEFDAS
jgi:cytochrome P450